MALIRKKEMGYGKIFGEAPPLKMLETLQQIYGFQTPRLARELWDIGENILREEKLWNRWFKPNISSVFYLLPKEFYKIEHKKTSLYVDKLSFYHAQFEKDATLEGTFLWRHLRKDFDESSEKFLYREIIAVSIMENEKEITYVPFVEWAADNLQP